MKVFPIFKKEIQSKIEMLLYTTSRRNYVLWLAGTHTGLRISDILNLRVSDVSGNILNITEKKTGKLKSIKISNKLKLALNDYIKECKLATSDILFTSRQSKGLPMTRQRVHQIIKNTANIIGEDRNISTHSMRKTFAYNLYKLSNNNIGLIMEALNHSKEVITLRYLCLVDDLLNDLVELL